MQITNSRMLIDDALTARTATASFRHLRPFTRFRHATTLAILILGFMPAFQTRASVSFTRVVGVFDPAPGTDGNFFYAIPGGYDSIPISIINNRGEVAFVAGTGRRDAVGVHAANPGLWKWTAGTARLIAHVGEPAPGAPGNFGTFYGVNLNDAGDVVFSSRVQANTQDPGTMRLFVDRGSGR